MLKKIVTINHLLFSIMRLNFTAVVLSAVFSMQAQAQVSPLEGSKLNSCVVGFSFPAGDNTTQYAVEIARGHFCDAKEFTSQVSQIFFSDRNGMVAEVTGFDTIYTWRVLYKDCRSVLETSRLYHFTTANVPENSTSAGRLRTDCNTR